MRWVVFFSVLATSTGMLAQGDDAVGQLSRLLAPMKTMQGQFQQVIVDAEGIVWQQSKGTFTLKRPGKFRWQTLAPIDQLLVSNQETLWLYDPDLEQVTVRPFDERLQQTPVLLLSGEVTKIRQHFEVERGKGIAPEQAFILRPKGKENLFAELQISFISGQLAQMVVRDSLGQTTTITLDKLVVNQNVEEQQFHFQPPPGTDVLIDE